jgi:hypothetical protein
MPNPDGTSQGRVTWTCTSLSAGTPLGMGSGPTILPTEPGFSQPNPHPGNQRSAIVTPTIGNFELRSPEPLDAPSLLPPQEQPAGNKAVPGDVLGLTNIERKKPIEPRPGLRRRRAMWPWAWLALTGVATVGWLIAMGWTAVTLVRWLLD